MTFRPRTREVVLAVLALALTALLLGHRLIPDLGGLGTLLESFLPWLGIPVVLLVLCAIGLRSRIGALATLLPLLAWAVVFTPTLIGDSGGGGELRVATQNVGAGNQHSAAAAGELADTGADLIAVQERTGPAVAKALASGYRYRAVVGTVGLWSRYPIAEFEPLDLAQGWPRALKARVRLPGGDVTVYTVHLASIRIGATEHRNDAVDALAELVDADPAERILVLGDLNTASTDRRFDRLTSTLTEARDGFGFTWPATMPLTRPDHILTRGFHSAAASVLATTGSDHRAALATLRPS